MFRRNCISIVIATCANSWYGLADLILCCDSMAIGKHHNRYDRHIWFKKTKAAGDVTTATGLNLYR
jgi:hypothetical protein